MTPLTWEDQKSVWFILAALMGFASAREVRAATVRPTARVGSGRSTPVGRPSTRRPPLAPPVCRRRRRDVTPRVSVVATVYNGEPYFDRAIPGILAQTFDDFEFILVDDGSTDRTPSAAAGAGGARSARPGVRPRAPGRGQGLQLRRGAGPGRIRRPPGLRRPELSGSAAAPGRAAGRATAGRHRGRRLPAGGRAARRALRPDAADGSRRAPRRHGALRADRPHASPPSAARRGSRPAAIRW